MHKLHSIGLYPSEILSPKRGGGGCHSFVSCRSWALKTRGCEGVTYTELQIDHCPAQGNPDNNILPPV